MAAAISFFWRVRLLFSSACSHERMKPIGLIFCLALLLFPEQRGNGYGIFEHKGLLRSEKKRVFAQIWLETDQETVEKAKCGQ
ncbi:uncharacterized protein A4U43_C04F28310 [Asparagus officinalis]|uniref:Uncharacterized protein n=1 Tax=Asparagus officinalis TaxID=4686 RepID=A0A5P1F9J4_ASPOF|nr:uncharacterized protein A4U43_C04F28310 [Asparagus officinalis]